ncbi:hypothetical protein SAICODRAFT_30984 [Saitoella complicata NRRL Y-17804]|nr:uncharacterized protein SAICODRAFT_30984 [Saitoella complicata NRRL Y-17804]ODQ51897.1 hypothetical protein SAICODRAFT_30984 [Saitoella complicata NRRL Y-17804]
MFFYFVLSLLIGLFGGSLLLYAFRQLSKTKYVHQYPLKFILRDEGRIRLSGDGEEDLESSWGTFGGESGEGGSRGPYYGYYYHDHDQDQEEDGVDDGITDGAVSVERYRDDIELEEEDAEGHRIVRRSSVPAALGRAGDEEEDVFLRKSDDEGAH